MSILEDVTADYERVQALVERLIARATGGFVEESDYLLLREYFVKNANFTKLIPRWLVSSRSLSQFWNFISKQSSSYAGRREFIWNEFEELLAFTEREISPAAGNEISIGLKSFDSESINHAWRIALERQEKDPEGAITAGRCLLESVLKHILEKNSIQYDEKIELHRLYKMASDSLNLSPEQHSEKLFKQILGGCSSVVNGLGTLRNTLGDAHGKGVRHIRPAPRHARLVVNLAGSMALFLTETLNKK